MSDITFIEYTCKICLVQWQFSIKVCLSKLTTSLYFQCKSKLQDLVMYFSCQFGNAQWRIVTLKHCGWSHEKVYYIAFSSAGCHSSYTMKPVYSEY